MDICLRNSGSRKPVRLKAAENILVDEVILMQN